MKKKIAIISIPIALLLIVLIALLIWGFQPVEQQKVTLEKLNKELSSLYKIPSKLPFEGDSECYISYVKGHEGAVITKFEVKNDKAQGYTIKLSDSSRQMLISTGGIQPNIAGESDANSAIHKDVKVNYKSITNSDNISVIMQFALAEKTYQINVIYDTEVEQGVMVSDITFILDQII